MTPKVMGILNVTPNSFSDGGQYVTTKSAIEHGLEMIAQGADIIDIGGESTRPGSEGISVEDELNRVIPVIEGIKDINPDITISVDTTKYEVAWLALEKGAKIINDVSGLTAEPKFVDLAKEYDADLVIMHKKGSPKDMQDNPQYKDVVNEVYDHLVSQSNLAAGVGNVYIDVGIGFGKNLEHNIVLLKNLKKFNKITGKQLLGISRKAFIKVLYGIENAKDRDVHTAMIHQQLLGSDVDIIRVHNVKLIRDMLEINKTF
ncbi:MAG: dihydropteroate synthase [Ignavibacteriae bacterium HGW-Ignavibacteriae-4]|jgi:dihydropteroate synthase|nr:MAG: dihydropteroate synthase [Ignavibacteriae bacterium HGW-Ignavibacteriae-4]